MGENNPPKKEQKLANRKRALLTTIITFILNQWLIIGIGIVCVLGYYFPNVAKSGGIIRSEYSIMYGAVAVIFFISGLSIPPNKLLLQMFNWRLHIIVQGISFLLIPALVLAVVHIILAADKNYLIDRAVLAGYVLTACIPTTIASNVAMTRAAEGDDAAALVEVLIANFLGPFITPGWTETLLPDTPDFDVWRETNGNLSDMYRDVFKHIGLSVLLPLTMGQIFRWVWTEKVGKLVQKFYLAKLATACLLLLIWSTFSTCFATDALESLTTECVVFIVLFNVALYLFLTLICFFAARPPKILSSNRIGSIAFRRIPPQETIAICFCGAAKTTALGIPLLHAMWVSVDLLTKAKASVSVLLYTTEQVFIAHILVHFFRKWKRRLESSPTPVEAMRESV